MSSWVFDASVILAWMRNEAGGEAIVEHIEGGVVCSINLAEVVTRMIDQGMPMEQVLSYLTPFVTESADYDLAIAAGALREHTRSRGLSLGDRFCLALAQRKNLPVLTADRAWADLDLGVKVVLIR